MTFHVYEVSSNPNGDVLVNNGQEFSLAGHNLIYKAWRNQGQPIRKGWSVTADDLIRIYSGGIDSYKTRRLIIDYSPSNTKRIPLIEVLEIFVFNWDGATPSTVGWTPLMLRMRDVLDYSSPDSMTQTQRDAQKARLNITTYGDEFIEFLYLKGEDKGWNWGRNGATIAVFIHGEARDFFKQFF